MKPYPKMRSAQVFLWLTCGLIRKAAQQDTRVVKVRIRKESISVVQLAKRVLGARRHIRRAHLESVHQIGRADHGHRLRARLGGKQ